MSLPADGYFDASHLSPKARKFIEDYTGLSPEQTERHILEVRDRLWSIWQYRCIGAFRFLEPGISDLSVYHEVVEKLKNGQTLLDMGTCVGQTVRKLISDGVPSENLYATDLRPEYFAVGYDLFMDKDKVKSTFIATDIFNPSPSFQVIYGRIDIIYAGSFFHLFDWDDQLKVAKRAVEILRPQKGSMVVGRQVGSLEPGEQPRRSGTGMRYMHDEASMTRFWNEVGAATGTEWEVETEMAVIDADASQPTVRDGNFRRIRFIVRRK